MRRLWYVGVLSVALSSGEAQNFPSARDFVNKLYDLYEHPLCSECPKVFGKDAHLIFSPSLLRLIRQDIAKTPKGNAGALDFDPICACQDPDGLHVITLEISPTGPNRVAADVLVGYTGDAKQAIRLSLIHTPQGWRVDDVSTKGEASLRNLLK